MPLPTPPTRRKGLILDRIHPSDYQTISIPVACEQCCHFNSRAQNCTIGYNAENHLIRTQIELYARTGRMALCRYLEID